MTNQSIDIAEHDTLDEVLSSMSASERELALLELELDGLWDD